MEHNKSDIISHHLKSVELPFGSGNTKSHLSTPEVKSDFAQQLAKHTGRLTFNKTAFCVEDRPTVRFYDGVTDSNEIARRVAYQKPGGLYLAVTKAGVEADLAVYKKAKNLTDAYHITANILGPRGWQDSAHSNCGADAQAANSVKTLLEDSLLVATLAVSISMDNKRTEYLHQNEATKQRRLDTGFYEGWKPADHMDFASNRWPQNCFDVADVPHVAEGILQIDEDGYGFRKNSFILDTNQMAFAVTRAIDERMVQLLCGPSSEKERMRIGFANDEAHIVNLLVESGMPYFKI